MNLKKHVIYSLVLFSLGFFIHNGADYFEHNLISIILFPQDESLLEHKKLYSTGILLIVAGILIYEPGVKKEFFMWMLLSFLVMIVLNTIIFLPQYILNFHNMILTLILFYLICLFGFLVGELVLNKFMNLKRKAK